MSTSHKINSPAKTSLSSVVDGPQRNKKTFVQRQTDLE